MEYKIEKREDKFFAVTDQKFKDSIITVNLSNVFLFESFSASSLDQKSTDCFPISITGDGAWSLRYDEELSKLYMDFYINFHKSIDSLGDSFTAEVTDIDTMISECVDCIKTNGMLDKCNTIMKTKQELYKTAFINILQEKKLLLFSDYIVSGYAELVCNGRILGAASNLCINKPTTHKSEIVLLEYIGNSKVSQESGFNYSINLYFKTIDNKAIILNIDCSVKVYDDGMIANYSFSCLKYLEFNINEIDYEVKELNNVLEEKLGHFSVETPYSQFFISNDIAQEMRYFNLRQTQILMDNSPAVLDKYIDLMKPKPTLININSFMIKEFR